MLQKHFYTRHVLPALLPIKQNRVKAMALSFLRIRLGIWGGGGGGEEVIKKWQQMSLAAFLSVRPLYFLEKQEKQPCIQKKPKQRDLI